MPFVRALHQLRDQLIEISSDAPGALQLRVSLSGEVDALAWLGTQRCWPQFYWQSRCGQSTLMALGARDVCRSMDRATARLHALPPHWQLVGGNAVDGESYLFLPILSLRQDDSGQWLSLHLLSDTSLYQEARRLLAWLDGLLPSQPLPPLPRAISVNTLPDKSGWCQQVERALQAIRAGELDKVVLARASDFTCAQPLSAAALLAASQQINPRCYHFMLATAEDRALAGSSPERLYARHGTELWSEALAGTADIAEAGLLTDGKNQWENQLVVEDIRQRLADEVTALDVAAAELLPLRHLQHLRRSIHATLRHSDDARCVSRLQPSAAVYGLPRRAAAAFIHQHQSFQRGWYSGSIGYLSLHHSEFAVVLRCAEVRGNQARLYAGAGIVSGSDAQREWQEVEHKAATLGCLFSGENPA